MMWGIPKMSRRFLAPVAGLVALLLLGFWVFKIRGIQRLRSEILEVEGKLSKGQEMWRSSPPLSPGERDELQKAQERLLRALPKEKDVPPVLQDISRVAQDYNLSNLSLTTMETAAASSPPPPPAPGGGTSQAVVVQPVPAASPAAPGSPGPIDSFSIKLTFAGDYREIAPFLEALQGIPRLVTIQSLQLQRALPQVVVEVVLNAYYLKGDLSTRVK